MKRNGAWEAAKAAARIADVRRKGDLYSQGGDEEAKHVTLKQLKEAGFETLTPEEAAKWREKHDPKEKP